MPSVGIPDRVHTGTHLLLWQVQGRGDFTLDGKPVELLAGHAVWVPAGVVHAFTVHVNSVLLPLFFDAPRTATLLKEPTVVPVDRDLRTLLLAYLQSENSIIKPQADLARQILSLIERAPQPATTLPMPTSEAALSIAETLRFNPGDHRTLAELAASAHASTRTIERAFLAETGMTLRHWRIRNRLEAAMELLRHDLSVQAVAQRVGYASASAFHRIFRSELGMTPQEYVAQYHDES